MNIKMIVTYDGTRYFGWQKTKTGPSIQETLEKALSTLLKKPISIEAASRTDRGVHAKGQVAHFLLDQPRDLPRLIYSLNSLLPFDIRVLQMEPIADDFHPTLQALSKEYQYFICNRPVQDPKDRLYSWHIHEPLDVEAMRECAKIMLGTHDFAAFTTIEREDTMRTLFAIHIIADPSELLEICIEGDRFLYKMMRRLAGTLVAAGKRKISPKEISSLLETPNRTQAGMTAPAHGLFLYKVHFTTTRASL